MAKNKKKNRQFFHSLNPATKETKKQKKQKDVQEPEKPRFKVSEEESFRRFIDYALETCDAFGLWDDSHDIMPKPNEFRSEGEKIEFETEIAFYRKKIRDLDPYRNDKYGEKIKEANRELLRHHYVRCYDTDDYFFYTCGFGKERLKIKDILLEGLYDYEWAGLKCSICFYRNGVIWFNGVDDTDGVYWFYKATEKDCAYFNAVENGLAFAGENYIVGRSGELIRISPEELTVENTQTLVI